MLEGWKTQSRLNFRIYERPSPWFLCRGGSVPCGVTWIVGEQLWSAKQRQRNCFKSCSTWNRTILTTNPHVTGMAWDDRSTDWFIFLIDYYGMMPDDNTWTFDYLQFVPGFWGIGKSFRGSVQMSMIGRRWKMFLDKSSLIQFSVLSFPDEGLACLPSKTWASIIMLAITPVKAM